MYCCICPLMLRTKETACRRLVPLCRKTILHLSLNLSQTHKILIYSLITSSYPTIWNAQRRLEGHSQTYPQLSLVNQVHLMIYEDKHQYLRYLLIQLSGFVKADLANNVHVLLAMCVLALKKKEIKSSVFVIFSYTIYSLIEPPPNLTPPPPIFLPQKGSAYKISLNITICWLIIYTIHSLFCWWQMNH